MAKHDEPYQTVLVESFVASRTSGLHGAVHVRPCPGQGLPTNLHIECSKRLTRDYPVGTVFRIRAKLTDREGSGEFLYSYHGWRVDVVSLGKK